MTESEPPFGMLTPTAWEARLIALGRRLPPTKIGRRAASFIRSALSRTRKEPLDLEVLGQNMRLHAGNNACEKRLIVTPQFFDPGELAFLKARLHPAFVFLDIGCNVGTYSVFVAKNAGPDAKVVAVDPNAIVLERLAFNARANGLANIHRIQAAVSDAEGRMEFALDTANMGGSSLELDRRARAGRSIVEVPVRTLSGLVAEMGAGHIDAVKIDVEGFEDRVLMPFFASAPRHLYPRAIVIEENTTSWQGDLLGDLLARGYRRVSVDRAHNGIFVLDAP